MHRPASITRRRRALGRAPATPTSKRATGTRSRRGPTWLAGLALAAALVGGGSAPASAATRPTISFVSPSPAEGATLTTDSVAFEFSYNRKPQATETLVCSLSGPTSSTGPCDAPVASGAKGSRSSKSYSGLASGSYKFTVSLALTDGGTASATRHFSIAMPVRHIYWANSATGTIGRANVDGTGANQNFFTGASSPFGVAVDADHLYWTDAGPGTIGTLGRANLDGTSANQSFISGVPVAFGVAVDADHVYWTNLPDTIGRANLDGTGANPSFITRLSGPLGVAVDADHVYWADSYTRTIGRANLDGTGANQSFITGASSPFGVAVDAD
jgi:streptogramin lyase